MAFSLRSSEDAVCVAGNSRSIRADKASSPPPSAEKTLNTPVRVPTQRVVSRGGGQAARPAAASASHVSNLP
eukprot:CAMPEP_0173440386 /NCGR_PEP_ID=MMETSP1357-20121228/22788_1 /TAXON_ID=77926 /ORGANISM="Hemiselmis rufescens, Strain PCC563" /LENGTH=71 /DNA_ID=CAMNT_0014405859 /DNA_START=49 /DNA_END=261 /DNA_ORIENTATION=+